MAVTAPEGRASVISGCLFRLELELELFVFNLHRLELELELEPSKGIRRTNP